MIQLPRLLDGSMKEIARLRPVSVALTLNMSPLSTATMTLADDQPDVHTGAFVELFTPHGSAGIFRCTKSENSFSGTNILQLDQGLITLHDGLIPGESEQTTSVREALQTILSHQSMWKLGRVDVPDDELIAWSYDYSGLMDALFSILDQLPGSMVTTEQDALPWTLNLEKLTEESASECRLTRNIASLNVDEDRTDLCTRLYIRGLDAPLDADTIERYGIVERTQEGGEDLSAEDLAKEGQRFLDEHKHPALTVSISALDLSMATGEDLDTFYIGKMCRICLPDYGQTITQRVVCMEWADLYGEPQSVMLTLASKDQTTASEVKGLIVDTTTLKNRLFQQGKNVSVLAETIKLKADQEIVDEFGTRLSQAEIDLDGANAAILLKADRSTVVEQGERLTAAEIAIDGANAAILLKADQTLVSELGTRISAAEIDIDGANAEIELRARKDDVEAEFKVQSDRITANAAEIALKADRIDLEGLVTASELETVKARITNLTSGATTAEVLSATLVRSTTVDTTYLQADSINHNGELVSQRSITMGSITTVGKALSTGGVLDLQHSHAVTVSEDGVLQLGEVTAEGGNFNIADTQFYKDGVSAARAGVTLSSVGWQTGGRNIVAASNGRSYTVELPSFSASGGTAFNSSHKTTVNFSTPTVSVPLKSVEVDASSVYKAGWDAAVAMLAISDNIIKGPGSTVDTQADLYTITAGGTLNEITNPAQNTFYVTGYGRAYINGTQAASQYISQSTTINVGQ